MTNYRRSRTGGLRYPVNPAARTRWSRIQCAIILCAIAFPVAANDEPPDHYQQSCVGCHARMTGGEGEVLYQRKDRLVNDYNSLVERVRYCSTGTGSDWNEKQIEQVVRYLNSRFYCFATP